MSSSSPPRRFKPEPIETSLKSSRDAVPKQSGSPRSPKCNENLPKPVRKFAPQPVETSTKSNRKFAPEPIESTSRSTKIMPDEESSRKKPRRFIPEPIETTIGSNRKNVLAKDEPSKVKAGESTPSENTPAEAPAKKPRRRFAPQLIETAKRSRKAGDPGPAILPSDKTEATPGDGSHSLRKPRVQPPPAPPGDTPTITLDALPHYLDIGRARSPLSLRSTSRGSTRSRHSFRIPDLEPIESSESEPEGSNLPSLSTSPSAASDQSYMYKEATRMRESVDDRFSGYLLELAARAAEKQLRDQAMAAFPNDDYHEPVDHFIDQELDESSVIMSSGERDNERCGRRDSSFKTVNWELLAMQQHRERLEQEQTDRQKREADTHSGRPTPAQSPWVNPSAPMFPHSAPHRHRSGGWQKDGELERMRSGAKPPMLGGDIEFPRCRSPDPARFDSTQGSHALRSSMCYLTNTEQPPEPEGLWHGKETPSKDSSKLWSQPNSRAPSTGGLWGGFCHKGTGNTPSRGPSGLLTPMVELENPFDVSSPPPSRRDLPPSPPPSNPDIQSIDDRLRTEIALNKEFSDDFVTQVYNYLSLGYPSIGRNFDAELSKISHIPISEMRQDDHLATSRGYIRLGEDGNLKETGITEETCVRWKALKLYVQEWARQQPKMCPPGEVQAMGGFGVAVRKGSWAI